MLGAEPIGQCDDPLDVGAQGAWDVEALCTRPSRTINPAHHPSIVAAAPDGTRAASSPAASCASCGTSRRRRHTQAAQASIAARRVGARERSVRDADATPARVVSGEPGRSPVRQLLGPRTAAVAASCAALGRSLPTECDRRRSGRPTIAIARERGHRGSPGGRALADSSRSDRRQRPPHCDCSGPSPIVSA